MISSPSGSSTTNPTILVRSIAQFEALGLDWGTAVIATAEHHGVRLMDVIVAAPRVEDKGVIQ